MAIKNYTTEVEVYKSLGEIQGALAGHGARKVMVDYNAAGQPTGIMFAIETPAGPRGFCLPANIDGVRTVFNPAEGESQAGSSRAHRMAQRPGLVMRRWRLLKPGKCKWKRYFCPI